MPTHIKPSDSLLPKKGKLLPKGAYKTTVKSRVVHEFQALNPQTSKVEDFQTWQYVLTLPDSDKELLAYSHDTFDVGMLVVAWVDIRRERDENHVPRSYNIVTKIREIRGLKTDPKILLH